MGSVFPTSLTAVDLASEDLHATDRLALKVAGFHAWFEQSWLMLRTSPVSHPDFAAVASRMRSGVLDKRGDRPRRLVKLAYTLCVLFTAVDSEIVKRSGHSYWA